MKMIRLSLLGISLLILQSCGGNPYYTNSFNPYDPNSSNANNPTGENKYPFIKPLPNPPPNPDALPPVKDPNNLMPPGEPLPPGGSTFPPPDGPPIPPIV